MEIDALKEIPKEADLRVIDGAVYSHFVTKHTPIQELKKVLNSIGNTIFIAKNSNSKMLFGKYGSIAADIFYINQISRQPGYTKLIPDYTHGKDYPIFSSYVRLAQDTPTMKIEMLSKTRLDTKNFEKVIDQLCYEAVRGYPASLKHAHNECKISSKEMDILSGIIGIGHQYGARELLE